MDGALYRHASLTLAGRFSQGRHYRAPGTRWRYRQTSRSIGKRLAAMAQLRRVAPLAKSQAIISCIVVWHLQKSGYCYSSPSSSSKYLKLKDEDDSVQWMPFIWPVQTFANLRQAPGSSLN